MFFQGSLYKQTSLKSNKKPNNIAQTGFSYLFQQKAYFASETQKKNEHYYVTAIHERVQSASLSRLAYLCVRLDVSQSFLRGTMAGIKSQTMADLRSLARGGLKWKYMPSHRKWKFMPSQHSRCFPLREIAFT